MNMLTRAKKVRYSKAHVDGYRNFITHLEQHELPEAVAITPGPHYITDYQVSDDLMSITGTALFPRIDPTLGSRVSPVEHANQTHHMLAGWNLAHVLRQLHGAFGLLALRTSIDTPEITRLDVPCRVEGRILHLDRTKVDTELEGKKFKLQRGIFEVSFYQDKGLGEVRVAKYTSHFVAIFQVTLGHVNQPMHVV